ncbi:hypothetical protein [Nostoc favosum]|uniref:Lipoprotein n=1 Tax=Nostoc favosum CHAB5714 TaxID=2780399 RepID=A0ABS8IKK4_9NOSO|nr:hypothetical protein [Nostoc favosum]MCC5604805.1 hypothetical protein [Nostoc favosum CHAB5714]
MTHVHSLAAQPRVAKALAAKAMAVRGGLLVRLGAVVALAALASGCVVQETRPLPKLAAVQATTEIPADELLDVGVRIFDPGLPKEIEDNPELAEKKGIYPDIRKAEARYMPNVLRTTLEGTGQWGAVRVVPATVDVMDVMVDGRIVESTGYALTLEVRVSDATGREWFTKTYEQAADTASYREGPGRARDPYQNVYVNVANDMLAYREQLGREQRVQIPRVADLRFAREFAPAAFDEYLAKDKVKDGAPAYRVVRLPADGDPVVERIERIRERDESMVDTVSDHYASFSEKMNEPYSAWRRSTYDEIEAEQRLRRQATTRKVLGAAAVLGGILMPSTCGGNNYNCERIEGAARTAAVAGGVMAVMSGIQKGKEAQMHTDALKEIAGSFQGEAAPMVVDVEGRTLKLTGTAEAQYAEWRKLLHELYVEETGLVGEAPAPDGVPATGAPAAPAAGAAAASGTPAPAGTAQAVPPPPPRNET